MLEKGAESPKIFNLKTPKFYMTPEIEKEKNPRRFTINSINCHTSEILHFADHYLRLVLKEIPSYIKGTNAFVKRINNLTVPKDLIIFIVDIKSIYGSIPIPESIVVVKRIKLNIYLYTYIIHIYLFLFQC